MKSSFQNSSRSSRSLSFSRSLKLLIRAQECLFAVHMAICLNRIQIHKSPQEKNESHTAGYIFGWSIVCIFCVSIQMEMDLIKWTQQHSAMVLWTYEGSSHKQRSEVKKNHVLTVGKRG